LVFWLSFLKPLLLAICINEIKLLAAAEEAAAEREYARKLAAIAKREQEELIARAKQEAEAQRLEAEAVRQRAKEEAEAAAKVRFPPFFSNTHRASPKD